MDAKKAKEISKENRDKLPQRDWVKEILNKVEEQAKLGFCTSTTYVQRTDIIIPVEDINTLTELGYGVTIVYGEVTTAVIIKW